MRAYLAKKGAQRKDRSALEPVKCFSADARSALAGKPAKSLFHRGTLVKTRHTTSQMFDLHDGAALIIQKGIMAVRGITGNGHKHPFVIPKAKQ
jgi:hypothetical protein